MHTKFLKNTKGTHKISQEVHKKFKRDFMKVWCTRTIFCDPPKKDSIRETTKQISKYIKTCIQDNSK